MGNTAGVVISYVFVFVFIGLANILARSGVFSRAITRKIVHIGVSNWWIIAMYTMDNPVSASIGPASFIIINAISYKFHVFKAMEHEIPSKNLGTIYFPISLLILAILSFSGTIPIYVGGMGILIMGYGDGLAAVVGEKLGKRPVEVFGGKKSFAGTLTMFAVSFAVAFIFIYQNAGDLTISRMLLRSFAVASVASIVEFVTPMGLDNLTVPLAVSLLYVGFFRDGVSLEFLLPFLGFAVNIAVGYAAYRRRSVSFSGMLGGIVVGTVFFVAGGLFFWLILMTFFATSTVLGGVGKKSKQQAEKIVAKGDTRDLIQVLANAGVGIIAAALYRITGEHLWIAAFAASFAAANSDTWASEIGMMSKNQPVSILTLRPLEKGTSGGVSALGVLASAGGSLTIALVFYIGYGLLFDFTPFAFRAAAYITIAGFAGSLVDSLIGASLQAQYLCATSGATTEKRFESGTPNELLRGVPIINNDMVNFLSGLCATGFAVLLIV